METSEHTIHALFAQLGLPDDEASVQAFIAKHSPLPPTVDLHCADFWTESQARMIRESLREDADWAIAVDLLNASLRAGK
jgi:hypothetical protein